jgi:hypothetical protein
VRDNLRPAARRNHNPNCTRLNPKINPFNVSPPALTNSPSQYGASPEALTALLHALPGTSVNSHLQRVQLETTPQAALPSAGEAANRHKVLQEVAPATLRWLQRTEEPATLPLPGREEQATSAAAAPAAHVASARASEVTSGDAASEGFAAPPRLELQGIIGHHQPDDLHAKLQRLLQPGQQEITQELHQLKERLSREPAANPFNVSDPPDVSMKRARTEQVCDAAARLRCHCGRADICGGGRSRPCVTLMWRGSRVQGPPRGQRSSASGQTTVYNQPGIAIRGAENRAPQRAREQA